MTRVVIFYILTLILNWSFSLIRQTRQIIINLRKCIAKWRLLPFKSIPCHIQCHVLRCCVKNWSLSAIANIKYCKDSRYIYFFFTEWGQVQHHSSEKPSSTKRYCFYIVYYTMSQYIFEVSYHPTTINHFKTALQNFYIKILIK